METLSQVLVAIVFTLLIGIPLGVWAAESARVRKAMRPVLDVLQTLPQLVYIIVHLSDARVDRAGACSQPCSTPSS